MGFAIHSEHQVRKYDKLGLKKMSKNQLIRLVLDLQERLIERYPIDTTYDYSNTKKTDTTYEYSNTKKKG